MKIYGFYKVLKDSVTMIGNKSVNMSVLEIQVSLALLLM